MTVCSYCREKNSQDANFCAYCGHKLISTSHCSQCGTEIKGNANFCLECGNQVVASPENVTADHKSSSHNEILDVILVARREKGKIPLQRKFMIFYKDSLIIVKGGMYTKTWEELRSGFSYVEKELGKRLVEIKDQTLHNAVNTPPEILMSDPENIFLKYNEIESIVMSQDFLKRSKIQIMSSNEVYKYDIEEYKLYKEYIQFLKSIFGDKLKS